MSEAVFLHYTQADLDRAYDQRAWAANAAAVIESYATLSKAVKERYPFTTEHYGSGRYRPDRRIEQEPAGDERGDSLRGSKCPAKRASQRNRDGRQTSRGRDCDSGDLPHIRLEKQPATRLAERENQRHRKRR